MISVIILFLCALSCLGSLYLLFSSVAAYKFCRRKGTSGKRPPVSVLKPLHGFLPTLAEDLGTLFAQPYPCFEVVFGVHDSADPAAPVAQAVMDAHPDVPARLVANGIRSGANPKVANLLNMMPVVCHDILVVTDADIAVSPDWLTTVADSFADPTVGAVTCAYVGRETSGLWADRLGANAINYNFLPQVLVAESFGALSGCFGATMAVRRNALEAIEGFEAIKDHLADDYELGHRIKQAGFRLVLAPVVVTHHMNEGTLSTLVSHDLRWGRTIRTIAPIGYALSILTIPTVPAIVGAGLALAVSSLSIPLAVGILVWVLLCRYLQTRVIDHLFALRRTAFLSILIRDFLSFAMHLVVFSGCRIRWNDASFTVDAKGRMKKTEEVQ